MIFTDKKKPAAVGAATDEKGTFARSPYTYDYTSERQFCQARLREIINAMDDISVCSACDSEIAYLAGQARADAAALVEVLKTP
ncbi:MAG: hypothetical protein IJ740_03370 [Ruminococcus sp.]|nr:hypothetical protein [Ruminococcus sp.]